MQKTKTKQFRKEKQWRRLASELATLLDQAATNLVFYDEPKHVGFKSFIVPRQDVLNRADAAVFVEICSMARPVLAKKKSDMWWLRGAPPRLCLLDPPCVPNITQRELEGLSPSVRKWFSPRAYDRHGRPYRVPHYGCDVPVFMFEYSVKRNYVKSEPAVVPDVQRALRETYASMYALGFEGHGRWHSKTPPKKFRKHKNRIERRKAKASLATWDGESCIYAPYFKGAAYEWF